MLKCVTNIIARIISKPIYTIFVCFTLCKKQSYIHQKLQMEFSAMVISQQWMISHSYPHRCVCPKTASVLRTHALPQAPPLQSLLCLLLSSLTVLRTEFPPSSLKTHKLTYAHTHSTTSLFRLQSSAVSSTLASLSPHLLTPLSTSP